MKLNCLIVDDEPIALEIIESYIEKIDFLVLVDKCNSAVKANEILLNKDIDILFLDINMPNISGLDLLKSLQNPPEVILTTAYSQYAVQSYELNVKDYLLKPISFNRFFKSINKVISGFENKELEKIKNVSDFMFFKSDKKTYKFYFKNILYFEGYGNYVKIHSVEKKTILILDKLSNLQNILSTKGFLRVHKSFIINMNLIVEIDGNQIEIGDYKIPIGLSYKDVFWKKIKQK